MIRVSTDIGGTFTDIVYLDNKGIHSQKVSSTSRYPDQAVIHAVTSLPPIASFSHGTTVATNALLERKGAQVAFLVTKGFGDLLHIGRQTRPRLYDFNCERPKPVVDRKLCYEVPERLAPDGSVIHPLSRNEAESLANTIKRAGAEVAAICLLFSYKNPNHEILLENTLTSRGILVSRSSNIIPEFREYERASTTTINAFIQQVLHKYLEKIRIALCNAQGPSTYYVMKSNGGVATSQEVFPVEAILSGPAGGVAGAVFLGREIHCSHLVTFDMGGTSADFSALVDYTPLWTDEGQIDGLPIRLPILDITTIGAGGGSIAWLDEGGALRVGPESAGAEPGPACYDRGGIRPTVTDANVLAGLMRPESFATTGIMLNPKLSESVFTKLAEDAHLNFEEAVLGVRSVVNASMLRGIRRTTIEKGIDVRTCSLLAFGGAGPLHAADLARELGIREVIVPPCAGVFSALGILLSEIKLDFSQSILEPLGENALNTIEDILKRFKKKAWQSLQHQGLSQGKGENDRALLTPFVDVRYKGQSFHLSIPYNQGVDIKTRFRRAYTSRYGRCALPDTIGLEIVTVRLTVQAKREHLPFPRISSSGTGEPIARRRILEAPGWIEVPIFRRGDLPHNFFSEGAAVIEDSGSTIYVPSDFLMEVDALGCLRMKKKS